MKQVTKTSQNFGKQMNTTFKKIGKWQLQKVWISNLWLSLSNCHVVRTQVYDEELFSALYKHPKHIYLNPKMHFDTTQKVPK